MSDALITLSNISLSHNGKNILDDVSFKLHQGEFVTLIGPNGAGKSSLIKILLGVIKQVYNGDRCNTSRRCASVGLAFLMDRHSLRFFPGGHIGRIRHDRLI